MYTTLLSALCTRRQADIPKYAIGANRGLLRAQLALVKLLRSEKLDFFLAEETALSVIRPPPLLKEPRLARHPLLKKPRLARFGCLVAEKVTFSETETLCKLAPRNAAHDSVAFSQVIEAHSYLAFFGSKYAPSLNATFSADGP